MNNKCELDSMGEGLQGIWNWLFRGEYQFIEQLTAQLCSVSGNNIFIAVLIAIGLPFLEAFLPMLPYTAFIVFNVGLFGGLLGFVFSLIGTVAGSMLLFLLVRYFLQKRMVAFLKSKNQTAFYDRISAGVDKHGVLYVFLLYGVLGLIVPSSLCTISLGLTNFPKKEYLIGLFLGKGLITGVVAIFGKSIFQVFDNKLLLVGIIVGAAILYFGTKAMMKKLKIEV